MLAQIIFEIRGKTYDEMYTKIGEKIHNSLEGSKDYIDSNVVLDLETVDGIPECTLVFSCDYCPDKEYIREKAKNAIDIIIDSL